MNPANWECFLSCFPFKIFKREETRGVLDVAPTTKMLILVMDGGSQKRPFQLLFLSGQMFRDKNLFDSREPAEQICDIFDWNLSGRPAAIISPDEVEA